MNLNKRCVRERAVGWAGDRSVLRRTRWGAEDGVRARRDSRRSAGAWPAPGEATLGKAPTRAKGVEFPAPRGGGGRRRGYLTHGAAVPLVGRVGGVYAVVQPEAVAVMGPGEVTRRRERCARAAFFSSPPPLHDNMRPPARARLQKRHPRMYTHTHTRTQPRAHAAQAARTASSQRCVVRHPARGPS